MEVKQSMNRAQVIGTLKEMNMQIETRKVTLKKNGVEKEVTCEQINKPNFKEPMFVVESKGSDVAVDFFPISEKALDDDGNVVENSKFKAMKTVMENYIPKSKDADNATRVKIDGSLSENGYVGKDFNWKSFPQINGFQITSSNVPEEDSTDSEISGVIRTIIPETKGEDAEETGRLKVELYSFDYNGATSPCVFIVEEDLADDFNSYYEVGQSVKLYYEIVTRQVGAKKVSNGGGFGRRESKMVSGFSVTEYSVFRGDDPFDEDNEYYVDMKVMNQAMNEREMMINTKIDEKKNASKDSPKSSVKSSSGASPFGNSNTKAKKSPF